VAGHTRRHQGRKHLTCRCDTPSAEGCSLTKHGVTVQVAKQRIADLSKFFKQLQASETVASEQTKLLQEMQALRVAQDSVDGKPVTEAQLGALQLHKALIDAREMTKAAQADARVLHNAP
jgi:hypothetical protein